MTSFLLLGARPTVARRFCAKCTIPPIFRAKTLCKLTKRKSSKPLDKSRPLWYNIYVIKREE